MPKDHKEITDDEILNYEDATTGVMARYERLMQMRSIEAQKLAIEASKELANKLHGVMETVHRASLALGQRTDAVLAVYKAASVSQRRQQNVVIFLSVVIALATVAYTWVTWTSVLAMREGNAIQQHLLEQSKPK